MTNVFNLFIVENTSVLDVFGSIVQGTKKTIQEVIFFSHEIFLKVRIFIDTLAGRAPPVINNKEGNNIT